ncbi:MAG: RNB domain-containing ribonuclease, partial [Clostridia bacterium]|nr:RNB domain-containing ribonuclease [Clostridia bacterium]
YKIAETAIKSQARLTYHKVAQVLEGNMAARNEYADFIEMFENMRELALILRDKRMRRGAIDFDFPEPYFQLDEDGNVVDIKARELAISNKIIEEFMLVANETIAKHCEKEGIPSVYRVHEDPDPEKIENLVNLVRVFGHKLKVKDKVTPKAMQSLLFRVDGTNAQTVLSTVMLRSMMKARYCEENLGHFGLAAEFYCHFTSPIRRYPDLIVHRILKEWLNGNLDEWRVTHYNKITRRAAEQSSVTEADATTAERDYDSFMSCEYMSDKIGQEFTGVISSITDFGFFVELPNTVEGLVRMVDLSDDYYDFDEDTMLLTGRRTGRIFCMGQQVKVRLAKVNGELKQIDFVLPEFIDNETPKEVKRQSGKGHKRTKKGRKKKYRSK